MTLPFDSGIRLTACTAAVHGCFPNRLDTVLGCKSQSFGFCFDIEPHLRYLPAHAPAIRAPSTHGPNRHQRRQYR